MHNKSSEAFTLTLFELFGLHGSCFHPLLALHDLSEPEWDVIEVVRLGFLGFPIPFELLVTEVWTHYSPDNTYMRTLDL